MLRLSIVNMHLLLRRYVKEGRFRFSTTISSSDTRSIRPGLDVANSTNEYTLNSRMAPLYSNYNIPFINQFLTVDYNENCTILHVLPYPTLFPTTQDSYHKQSSCQVGHRYDDCSTGVQHQIQVHLKYQS